MVREAQDELVMVVSVVDPGYLPVFDGSYRLEERYGEP